MNTRYRKMKAISRKSGFTLVETIVSLAVFGIAIGGIMSFFIYGMNFASLGIGKLNTNRNIRKFTSEMSQNATFANDFVIYSGFSDRSQLSDGKSGDFLVLIYKDPNDFRNTSRIVGYYRNATSSTVGPVLKFERDYSPSTTTTLADLLPAISTIGGHAEVVELSKGLSSGRLFYNFLDRSIMIKGEFQNKGTSTRDATNTYNFTISPRG